MNFKPKSEEECSKFKLLEKGDYEFEILSAIDKISKSSGNEMIELVVRIYADGEPAAQIFDYLMESVSYKLRHCAAACGLLKHYDVGVLQAEMFVGKTGVCSVVIQKDKTGQYSDKNVIRDYLVKEVSAQAQAQTVNDGLPF